MTPPRIVATVEARMGSSRLPGKVLMPAAGQPLLQILVDRLRRASHLTDVMIATTTSPGDDAIAELADTIGVPVFRGSENDVLGRVCGALDAADADVCVEITGDCPLIDPDIVDETISAYLATADTHPYVSNSDPYRSVPAGLDVQVFPAEVLAHLNEETKDPDDREHVSFGFYRPESGDRWNPRFIRHAACKGAEDLLVTLDYLEDYELIRRLHEDVSAAVPRYGAADIIEWIRQHPELHEACRRVRAADAG
jgi:spore coat polysaccharide biosynthesis protein SpsF